MSLALSVILYASLLMLLAVISAMETAIHSVGSLENRIERVGGGIVGERLRQIAQNPFSQLQQALLLSAALNLALAALGLHLVTGPLRGLGWHPWVMAGALFLLTVLFGDVLPKLVAVRRPESVLVACTRFLSPARVILDPIAGLADRVADAMLRGMVGKKLKIRSVLSRDEFETLVEMRHEQGLVNAEEAEMIQEVLDVEDLTVRDAMVPRVDLPLLPLKSKETEARHALERATGRFVVVYRDTPDAVEGVIDSVAWKLNGRRDWKTRPVIQSPVFVPETMPMLEALNQHLRDPSAVVLIVDEYGGLEGMVSQEQIADWLLYDAAPWLGEDSEIRELGQGRFLADGGARVDHLAEELGIEMDSGGIDTIGGLVFNLLGHVPKAGERVAVSDELEIKVRRVVRARVQQVELRLRSTEESAEQVEAKEEVEP